MLTPDEILEQSQWDLFWVPADTLVVDKPELLYTVCERDSIVLNTVGRSRGTGSKIKSLVAEVAQAHTGRASRWSVCPQNNSPELLAALKGQGYKPGHEHDAYTLAAKDCSVSPSSALRVEAVKDAKTLADAMFVSSLAFGLTPRTLPEQEWKGYLADCTGPRARVHRFVVYDAHDEPLASAGMTSFSHLDFAFLWAGGTRPMARGQGAYSALIEARAKKAEELGIKHLGLYARLDTSAPIVAKQGFAAHGRMQFWERH